MKADHFQFIYSVSKQFFDRVAGVKKPVDAADLPDVDDGSRDHAGAVAARRGTHGGEDHSRNSHLQEDQTQDRGVRVTQSHHHA